MDVNLKNVQEWYAKKCNKTVKEFDEYDMFCSKVAYDYATEALSIGGVSGCLSEEYIQGVTDAYAKDPIIIAYLCDETLDNSGALLGRVREAYNKR